MLKIIKVSDVVGMKIFTDSGDFLGVIEEANLLNNKVDSWRIRIARDSTMAPFLSGAKGLIIPHQYIKAIGEVVLISRSAIPVKEEALEEFEESL